MKNLFFNLIIFFIAIFIASKNFAQTPVSGNITINTTWTLAGSPYQLTGDVTVNQYVTLTIQSGVEVQLTDFSNSLFIKGTLLAEGTPQNKIRFIGNSTTTKGGFIEFNSISVNSVLTNVYCENLGLLSNNPSLSIKSSSVSMTNVEIINSDYYGIRIENCSPSIQGCTVNQSGSYGIYIVSGSPIINQSNITQSINYAISIPNATSHPIISNCLVSGTGDGAIVYANPASVGLFSNNSFLTIKFVGSTITENSTWPVGTGFYIFNGDITVDQYVTLTIQSGVEIQLTDFSNSLFIKGTLLAEGTPQNKIRFIGNSTTTKGGFIEFNSISVNSVLTNVYCENLGLLSNNPSLSIKSSSVSMTNVEIINSDYYGIRIENCSPSIQGCTVNQSGSYGIYIVSGFPTINQCNITGNSTYGINNIGTSNIDATNNWWGHATGPYHPTLNPNGQGDHVSDKVNFTPWLLQQPGGYKANIKVSYILNSQETIVQTVEVPLNEPIGDLSFDTDPTTVFLTMPTSNSDFYNSKTFILTRKFNNDQHSYNLQTIPFQINNTNHCNITCKFEILNQDQNQNNNIFQRDAEIWLANFEYGANNYQFYNWSIQTWEIGEMLAYNLVHYRNFIIPRLLLEWYKGSVGHCYGFASSSILYRDHPGWIPGNTNLSPLFTFNESFDLRGKIREAHYHQVFPSYVAFYSRYSPWYSLTTYSNNQLSKIKNSLSNNSLLISAFDKHATVLHSMIKSNNYYKCYEYNNNTGPYYQHSPNQRYNSQFNITNSNVEFLGNSDIFFFEVPDFSLNKDYIVRDDSLNMIMDSLMQREITSLTAQNRNVIIYRQNYSPNDSVPVANLSCTEGLLETVDLGTFKILYFDNIKNPNISFNANKTGSFSLLGLKTYLNKSELPKEVMFENILFSSENSKASISSIFASGDRICQIDINGDGTNDLEILNSYNNFVPTSINLPPALISDIPVVVLKTVNQSIPINLIDHIYDENIAGLTYSFNYDNALFDVQLANSIVTVILKSPISDIKIISMTVSDGIYSIKIPIYVSSLPVGIQENAISSDFSLFPNPCNTTLNISIDNGKPHFVTSYEIIDISGRIIKSGKTANTPKTLSIDVRDINNGLYLIKLNTSTNIVYRKSFCVVR